ncbi:adenylate cyclase [Brevibacterium sanguinis]|uniref:Adenylate cyclase n=2 Tax=Brevibacterium TaxID=1696 RepID=A0A366IM32_9MICO|nr:MULTISPECIES: adenylate/guanylate cyclase domain-containing protein [Brevibacterium]RBP66119.1 adenylate cyclase [Brevibacterium sanguinis]RBP72770.1 adenylate cyclase [Brevibacterium celere]
MTESPDQPEDQRRAHPRPDASGTEESTVGVSTASEPGPPQPDTSRADENPAADAQPRSDRSRPDDPRVVSDSRRGGDDTPVPPAASAEVDEAQPRTSAMPIVEGPTHTVERGDDAVERGDDAGDFAGGLHSDPRTAALDVVEDAEDSTIDETRSAAERLEEILLDGKRVLDRREAAKLGGISTVSARKMWRALGMPQAGEDEKAYTVSDAHALRIWAKPVADGLIDQETALSLARAIGQTTDRLVVWQMETLVEFLTEEKGLTDPEARRDALQVLEEMVDPLQRMLTYSWRRNLAEAMGRLNVNVSQGLAMDNRQGWYDSSMPLARAVGFIDLVSYTRLSQKMEPRQLANMVQKFQGIAYNIVSAGGGRVIKTVGDEVFFAAETPTAGAEIAMTLMERVSAEEDLPQARVGFAWGRVLSRLGDIFGSSVNLAARLTAVAEPGTIYTDEETARVLSTSDAYVFEPRESLTLQGLGETGVRKMTRGTAARMQLDIEDEA